MLSHIKWVSDRLVFLLPLVTIFSADVADAASGVVANVSKYCATRHPGSSVQIVIEPEPHPECCQNLGQNDNGQPTFKCEQIDPIEACKLTIENVDSAVPGLNILCIAAEDDASKCKQDRRTAEKLVGCTALIEKAKESGRNPEPWVYLDRGYALEQFGKTSEAIEDYNSAIELNAGDPVGYIERGNAYVRIGEPDKGRKDLEKARSLDMDDAFTVYNLGVLEEGIGNFEAAGKHYWEAVRLDPDFPNAYNNRANVYCKLGQVENSVEDRIMVTKLGLISANAVQNFLGKHGYYKGGNTEVIDTATVEALTTWTSDGCPGI